MLMKPYHLKIMWSQNNSKILSRNLGIMRKLKHIFSPNVLRLLYFSLIHPYILYCSSIWLSTFPSIVFPIRVVQNNVIRVFCGVGNQESWRSVYRDLNIMPATGLRDFYTLIFINKYYSDSLPDCFYRNILWEVWCSPPHSSDTR